MTCERIALPDGGVAIVCTRGRRPKAVPCTECKWREHTLLCDFPLRGEKAGKTCSRRLCAACAVKRDELDLCPAHARAPAPAPRPRIFDHLDGAPEDRVFSRVARAMRGEEWWSRLPVPGDPDAVAGEITPVQGSLALGAR